MYKRREKSYGGKNEVDLTRRKRNKEHLKKFFNGTVKSTCPSQHQCQEAMSLSKKDGGIIWKRPRDNIKSKVNGMLIKLKR